MAQKVLIGCRLPNGLTITNPLIAKDQPQQTITILGLNSSNLVDRNGVKIGTHVTTEIDADVWLAWKAEHQTYPPFVNGSIFEAKGQREADEKGKELTSTKTGFEPIAQDAKVDGVKIQPDTDK